MRRSSHAGRPDFKLKLPLKQLPQGFRFTDATNVSSVLLCLHDVHLEHSGWLSQSVRAGAKHNRKGGGVVVQAVKLGEDIRVTGVLASSGPVEPENPPERVLKAQ